MRYGYDTLGIKTFIDASMPYMQYHCTICGGSLEKRIGRYKRHHYYHKCTIDTWRYDDLKDWYLSWIGSYPMEAQEITLSLQNHKHRADIIIEEENLVIEFQYGPLTLDEFKNRNSFFSGLGYQVIWVFSFDRFSIRENWKNNYTWDSPNLLFRKIEIHRIDAIIYIERNGKLERVVFANRRFTNFSTYKGLSLTKVEFIEYSLKDSQLLLYGRERRIAPEEIIDGESLYQLWEPEYCQMVVKNMFTEDIRIIYGKDGKMKEIYGYPCGTYGIANSKSLSGYSTHSRSYPIKDSRKKIWKRLHFYLDSQFEERRIQYEAMREERKRKKEERTEERKRILLKRYQQENEKRLKYILKLEETYDSIYELFDIEDLYVKNMFNGREYKVEIIDWIIYGKEYSSATHSFIDPYGPYLTLPDTEYRVWKQVESPKEFFLHSVEERKRMEELQRKIEEANKSYLSFSLMHPGYLSILEIIHTRKNENLIQVWNAMTNTIIDIHFRKAVSKYVSGEALYDYYVDAELDDSKNYKIWKRL